MPQNMQGVLNQGHHGAVNNLKNGMGVWSVFEQQPRSTAGGFASGGVVVAVGLLVAAAALAVRKIRGESRHRIPLEAEAAESLLVE